jgi:hypothetical protein
MFNCYCDYDAPQAYYSKMRKARRPHRCCECPGRIKPGEMYEYHSGIMDGSPFDGHTCLRCVEIREWMKANVPCFCWAHGNMIEDARETAQSAHEQAGDEVAGLRFGLLRRIALRDRFNRSRAEAA